MQRMKRLSSHEDVVNVSEGGPPWADRSRSPLYHAFALPPTFPVLLSTSSAASSPDILRGSPLDSLVE